MFAVVIAWGGYYFVTFILRKIFAENEKLNGKAGETQVVSSITVDGEAQEVEITIDGETPVNAGTYFATIVYAGDENHMMLLI